MVTAVPAGQEFIQRTPVRVLPARASAWCAVLVGSKLPQIVCRQFNYDPGFYLAFAQVTFLLLLAAVARKQPHLKGIAGFILAVAALSFAWLIIVPSVEGSHWYGALCAPLGWQSRFALARLLRAAGAVLMLVTLIGSGLRPRDLFLKLGNWRAPVQSRASLNPERRLRWSQLTGLFLVVSFLVIPGFYLITLQPRAEHVREFVRVLPLALVLSAFNAANEEFQFRSVLLARLRNVLPASEAFLLSAVLFGLDHYFGQPSGWGGTILAGMAGWIWAKSMVETKGFTCAFVMHFVEDLLILASLVTSIA